MHTHLTTATPHMHSCSQRDWGPHSQKFSPWIWKFTRNAKVLSHESFTLYGITTVYIEDIILKNLHSKASSVYISDLNW